MLERVRPLLGTLVAIRAEGIAAQHSIEQAFAAIEAVQARMSFHAPDSELSYLNRHAAQAPIQVSPSLRRVLRASLALARASAGRFDPSVAWRLNQWRQLPRPEFTPDVAADACWRDVQLLRDGRVWFRKALWLDLGGIAKGYAVDQAIRAMRAAGAAQGIVNAGGDLRAFGIGLETIRVRHPGQPGQTLPVLHLREGAVATSAGYFSKLHRRTALVHPLRGTSMGHSHSVTVCSRRALWADALTKIVLAAPKTSIPLLRRLRSQAVLIGNDGRLRHLH